MIGYVCLHGRCHSQGRMNPSNVVVHKIQGQCMPVILNLLEWVFVNLVERLIPIRICKVIRSA